MQRFRSNPHHPCAVASLLIGITACGATATYHGAPPISSNVESSARSARQAASSSNAATSTQPDDVAWPTRWEPWAVAIAHHHAVMLGMRLTEVWLWPEPFADVEPLVVSGRYVTAFTQPPKWNGGARAFEWDGDPWWINGVGHALFGSELYMAARRCQFAPLPATLLATLGSAVWEYGYEANGVRPSALDLVYTPLAGALLGEMRHLVYHAAAGLPSVPKTVLRGLMDPFGEVERAFGSPC